MKYKHCPDCGNPFSHWKSSDGWAETYQCPKCKLEIHISFGETMHAAGDNEHWIRVVPEPRKPREWTMGLNIYGELIPHRGQGITVRVREVLEPDRDTKTWWAEIPTDGSVGQVFTDS